MIALIYDGDGRIVGWQSTSCTDPIPYLQSEMAKGGITQYVIVSPDQQISPSEFYIDTSTEEVQPRPLIAARTPGALPWTIPQAEGETVTVRNEGGDIVESDDHTDPVTITDAGTYAITVSAAFPAITWRGSVDLA